MGAVGGQQMVAWRVCGNPTIIVAGWSAPTAEFRVRARRSLGEGRARAVEIRAAVVNRAGAHEATVATDGRASRVAIPAKETGAGSSLNGGELLCLALATCYCNDLYREAAARQLPLETVEVAVVAEFGGRGEPARCITYTAHVTSPASAQAVAALLAETDRVAEVHNTLRQGVVVQFAPAPPAP